MKPYATLSRRGQLERLRGLARRALESYAVQDARLTPLRHEYNTTWRVDTPGERFVLRINRPGTHSPAAIGSEMAWLAALRRDTGLGVPEPALSTAGSPVVLVDAPGVPEPRACVLLHWLAGRFFDAALQPRHLRQVARLQVGLQQHALAWTPPGNFERARVENLSDAAKREGVFASAAEAAAVEHPTFEDADRSVRLVAELVSIADAGVFAAALDIVWSATRELAAQPGSFGLIHADLHQENVLFHGGAARAIDFDDCGWGFWLYDLTVTLSELQEHPRYAALRDALLDEYSRHRPLPARTNFYLDALAMLRRMQLLIWQLESREHVAFRSHWQRWVRADLDDLQSAVEALR